MRHRGKRDPSTDPTSVGNILVKMGVIKKDQLAKALKRADGALLGQSLVAQGYISEMQLFEALRRQKRLRGRKNATQALEEARECQMRLNGRLDELTATAQQALRDVKD